jgi:hypothetical protein
VIAIRSMCLSILVLCIFVQPTLALALFSPIQHVKQLFTETKIVESAGPEAVIVVPGNSRYSESVNKIQEALKAASGVSLEVYSDDQVVPQDLLKTRNVIALGNMNTNAFIERLYCEWYVILDLKYPGLGGYVVRSLHNPYGTGHNVIFLGGSDDAGVRDAVDVFLKELRQGSTVEVGWLMKIKLGKGLTLPEISPNMREWRVYSWEDSWRETATGQTTGYLPATFFGWNPISIAGALYYLTGEDRYLKYFKELALTDASHSPPIIRNSDAFDDPGDPLVKSYHYRAHLVDCVWDLIEESPAFSDRDRLFITNKLLQHQAVLDPTNTYAQMNGDRHALYHLLCIYTGSRYFSKYYPNDVWTRRLQNARNGFCSLIGNPTWGDRDTLDWVSTSIEPVFDFFIMDGGADEFLQSGTAKLMASALKILMTGEDIDDYNRWVSIGLLYKAAYLLKDSGYIWMAQQLHFDPKPFRIGQAFWPNEDQPIHQPDISYKILTYPLAKADWEQAKTAVPLSEAFQILSYRTGLSKKDDYFLLDGFNGLGRNPSHLNNLTKLRMFDGKTILDGYANDISIWRNGMVNTYVARSAGLRECFATKNVAYMASQVPDLTSSKWLRTVFYQREMTIVVDRITAIDSGLFDVACLWQFGSDIKLLDNSSHQLSTTNFSRLSAVSGVLTKIDSRKVKETTSRKLNSGETIFFANVFDNSFDSRAITGPGQGPYYISGGGGGVVIFGDYSSTTLSVKADFAYLTKARVFIAGARELRIVGSSIFESGIPLTFVWELKNNELTVKSSEPVTFRLKVKDGLRDLSTIKGEETLSVKPHDGLTREIEESITYVKGTTKINKELPLEKDEKANALLTPAWTVNLNEPINYVGISPGVSGVWAIASGKSSSRVFRISNTGEILKSKASPGTVQTMFVPKDVAQEKAFSLLLGYKDDRVQALSSDGVELWSFKAAIHDSFKVGDRYEAPWFTDPRPPFNMTGIYSILVADLWNEGKETIVVGRPSTVEFHSLDGKLMARVPTKWGNDSALAVLNKTGQGICGNLLLVGKSETGSPDISAINEKYSDISDSLFTGILPDYSNMHAWLQRGVGQMTVNDINGDEREEVIVTFSGHFNELRVYDGESGTPLWIKYFGPDKSGGKDFMRGLSVLDSGKGKDKMVVVGMKSGWLHAFDDKGDLMWQKHSMTPITTICSVPQLPGVLVGYEDGEIELYRADGTSICSGSVKSSVNAIAFLGGRAVVATEKGNVASYTIR